MRVLSARGDELEAEFVSTKKVRLNAKLAPATPGRVHRRAAQRR
jgi:hypothetical protein